MDVYLRETHGIECRCLSRYLSHEELAAFRTQASAAADRVLAALDERVAPALNRELGLKMRYFTPLYSYYGKHYLLGQIAFVEGLRKAVQAHELRKIKFCRSPHQIFLNVDPDIKLLLAQFLPSVEAETIDYSTPLGDRLGAGARLRRFLASGRVRKFARDVSAEAARFVRARLSGGARKTILLAEQLYFFEFLKTALSGYDLILCRQDGSLARPRGAGSAPASPANLETIISRLPEKIGEPFEDALLRGIRADFARGIARYLQPVLAVKTIHDRRPISLGVWGNIGGFEKYLLFEYLRSEGVAVVGTQHGNSYVDQVAPLIFDSDFSRCDHFVSWGFDQNDLARAFPHARTGMSVHPLGMSDPPRAGAAGREIDVVFPLTLGMSLFNGGAARTKPDALLERQVRILEHLNSLAGRSVYVKLFPFLPSARSAVDPLLKRLKNLTVADDMFLEEFLKIYRPRAVVIDYPASSLFLTVNLDVEIFMMPDELNPYEAQALGELKKRVHYCEDTDALKAQLDLFFQGRLDKKRDQTYFNHYVHRPNARENTVRLIRSLAG